MLRRARVRALPPAERSWVREALVRATGLAPSAVTLVFDDEVVEIGYADTPEGAFLAVRTPVGEAVVPLPGRGTAVEVAAARPAEESAAPALPTHSLDAFDAIDAFRPELSGLGITTAAGLLAADPNVVAQATGAPLAIVKRWQAAADLLGLPGMEPHDALLMASIGVDSLADLSRRAAATLTREVNRRGEAEGHDVVYEETVRTWIEEARRRTTRRTFPPQALGG